VGTTAPSGAGTGVPRVGFLGPRGTFCEQAVLTQGDLVNAELIPLDAIPDVLVATTSGRVDQGIVPIENAIEGTVNVTMDMLAFEHDLLIQREVVIGVQMHLLGLPGSSVEEVKTVLSIPVATAQCRRFLSGNLPGVSTEVASSTAQAAEIVAATGDPTIAAIANARAGELHGLETLVPDIEDHDDNETKFVMVAPQGIPAPTGHDKTTVVIFQHANRPGSLLAILQEFAARAINLTNLQSRPTKKGLGHYCFIIDLEGHLSDELVADCLRDVRSKVEDIKFLGSYPAAGEHGPAVRRDAEEAWRVADAWIREQKAKLSPS
jgi:prephenate dehydratase